MPGMKDNPYKPPESDCNPPEKTGGLTWVEVVVYAILVLFLTAMLIPWGDLPWVGKSRETGQNEESSR